MAGVPYFGWTSPVIGPDAKVESKSDRRLLGCIGVADRWKTVGPQRLAEARTAQGLRSTAEARRTAMTSTAQRATNRSGI